VQIDVSSHKPWLFRQKITSAVKLQSDDKIGGLHYFYHQDAFSDACGRPPGQWKHPREQPEFYRSRIGSRNILFVDGFPKILSGYRMLKPMKTYGSLMSSLTLKMTYASVFPELLFKYFLEKEIVGCAWICKRTAESSSFVRTCVLGQNLTKWPSPNSSCGNCWNRSLSVSDRPWISTFEYPSSTIFHGNVSCFYCWSDPIFREWLSEGDDLCSSISKYFLQSMFSKLCGF